MLVRLRSLQGQVLPRGWLDVLRQVSLFAVAYGAYRIVRGLVENDGTAAFQHAREVIQLERTLHVFVEPSIQAWASSSHFVMELASWVYVNAQFSVTVGALLFLYLQRNRSFYFVRNMLLIGMAIALVGYAFFPIAPPRFLPEWGFVDSVSDMTGLHLSHSSALFSDFVNPYAAMPSMHVAFALMIGWPMARLVRWRLARVLWLGYPFVIAFVIIATANHYIVDAVLGAVTAGISACLAKWLARLRADAWAFQPATSGAGG
jgi:membrane-associated phospholipid phosphatase